MTYYYPKIQGSNTKRAQEQDRLIAFDAHKASAVDTLNRLQDYLRASFPLPAKRRAFVQALSSVRAKHLLMWKLHPARKDDLDKIERLLTSAQGEFFETLESSGLGKALLVTAASFALARHRYSEMEYDLEVGKPGGERGRKTKPEGDDEYKEEVPCVGCGHILPPSAIKKRSKKCITCYRKDRAKKGLNRGWTVMVTDHMNKTSSFSVHATRRTDAVTRAIAALGTDLMGKDPQDALCLKSEKPAWQSADKRFIITVKKGK